VRDLYEGIQPSDLGFGEEFPEYRQDPRNNRPVQVEAIEFVSDCTKRVAAAAVPTGVGKSLIAVSAAKLTGLRTVILTATKGLESQYANTFGKYGLVDIRGRSNYQCGEYGNLDCRGGSSMGCRYCNGNGCEYERARDEAREAQMVVANYAYWLNVNDHAGGIERQGQTREIDGKNPVEMLILDEASVADQWLADYLAVRMYEGEVKHWVDPKEMGDNLDMWKALAEMATEQLKPELVEMSKKLREAGRKVKREEVERLHTAERLLQKFERIAGIKDDWVLELREGTRWGRMWAFDVIWPGRYAEQYLFCGVPKIVMMSATLRPKTVSLLGVKSSDCTFKEWARVFPSNRHPIYSVPAMRNGKEVRVDRRTSDQDMQAWVERIDEIIDGRLDRKGIIQTISYDRQQYLMNNSRHSGIMMGNTNDPESETAAEVAELFRKSPPPQILVSPSFAMGWDFPGSECEYIIICKVPFKPGYSKVMKAREERDSSYGAYLAMQEMVQSAGRGMRSDVDRCEVMVVDGHLTWFLYQNKRLAPSWFVEAVRRVNKVPVAPERL
jgi:Rad3-related DNA helicase